MARDPHLLLKPIHDPSSLPALRPPLSPGSPPQNHFLVLRAHSTRVPRISNLSPDLPYSMLSWQRLGTDPPWLVGSHNWSLATEMNNSYSLVSPEVILHPGSSRFNHTAPYLFTLPSRDRLLLFSSGCPGTCGNATASASQARMDSRWELPILVPTLLCVVY